MTPVRLPVRRPPQQRRAPAPSGRGLLGHLGLAKKDPLGFFESAWRAHGDVVRFRFGPLQAHLLVAPEHARHVLQEGARNFTRDVRGFDKLRAVLGNGLLTSEGELWLRQRRLLQPEFDRRALPRFAPAITQVAAGTAERWEGLARRGEIVDIAREMSALTLQVVGVTLLGTELGSESDGVAGAIDWLLHDLNEQIFSVVDLGSSLPGRRRRRFRKELEILDRAVYRILAERRLDPGGENLVARLFQAQQQGGGEDMSDRQLRDELMTFFLAGHETTANLLTWTWHLLARNPGAAEQLRLELDQVLGGRLPGAGDVERLQFTQRVLQESLRLYPPAWFLERRCAAGEEIDGFHLPRGSMAMICPYLTHRHPDHWHQPERFDPERFLPAAAAQRHRWAWFPFGGGARICIGKDFAMLESVIAMAVLAQRFAVEPADGGPVTPEPLVTLRPRGGLPARLRRLPG